MKLHVRSCGTQVAIAENEEEEEITKEVQQIIAGYSCQECGHLPQSKDSLMKHMVRTPKLDKSEKEKKLLLTEMFASAGAKLRRLYIKHNRKSCF